MWKCVLHNQEARDNVLQYIRDNGLQYIRGNVLPLFKKKKNPENNKHWQEAVKRKPRRTAGSNVK